MAALLAYLERAGERRFDWAEFNCLLFVADWIIEKTGIDPASNLRGSWQTPRQARQVIKACGGIEALMGDCLCRVRAEPTSSPVRGDVGLVRIPYRRWRERVICVPAGAIALGGNAWAIKPSDGSRMLIGSFPMLRAWTLP